MQHIYDKSAHSHSAQPLLCGICVYFGIIPVQSMSRFIKLLVGNEVRSSDRSEKECKSSCGSSVTGVFSNTLTMTKHTECAELSPKEVDRKTSVFTYGTLMSERVLQAVLGRVPNWSCGELTDFKRVSLGNERCYPGALPHPASKICGRVLHDLSADELARLDRFEGDEYEAVIIDEVLLASGEKVRARVWKLADLNGVLDRDWDYDKFLRHDENWYVEMCREWAADDDTEQQKCTAQRRGAL